MDGKIDCQLASFVAAILHLAALDCHTCYWQIDAAQCISSMPATVLLAVWHLQHVL